MLEKQRRIYERMTGAQIDIDQFLEIAGWRAEGAPVRIARAVDLWFSNPTTDDERRVKALVDKFRAAKVSSLEQEIFKQRKRLADAERSLAAKETKAAQESRRIAAAKVEKAVSDLPLYKNDDSTSLDGRVFPMTYAPIVRHVGGKEVIQLARYHLRRPGDPEATDRKFPGLYNARRDNLARYWRRQFGSTHALMLATSFYENVDRDGKNAVLQFTPRTGETMLIPCLFAEWTGETGAHMPCFAAVTDDPPPEIAAAGHDRVPINLTADAAVRWLQPEGCSDAQLQALLDERQRPFYEHREAA
jgi:putative SOS response-associated peptidase YedK